MNIMYFSYLQNVLADSVKGRPLLNTFHSANLYDYLVVVV
jgi:hypothetical protein